MQHQFKIYLNEISKLGSLREIHGINSKCGKKTLKTSPT